MNTIFEIATNKTYEKLNITCDATLNKRCFLAMMHNGDKGQTFYLENEPQGKTLGFFNMLYATDSKLSKEDFISNFEDSMKKTSRSKWVFDPHLIRERCMIWVNN